MIGYAFCGSFCTVERSVRSLEELALKHEVLPIFSGIFQSTDTRFGKASQIIDRIEGICGRAGIRTIPEAERLGPSLKLDALIIAPCTGNTLAKLACGITDSSVTMAAKAHLRNNRPLIIALATNDALSANLHNVGTMLSRKNVYFVPFGQDDPHGKPTSLVCDFSKINDTLLSSLDGIQLQPLLI